MKLFHKTLVAGAALAFAVMGTAFAEGEFTFKNEIKTDTWLIGDYFPDNRRFGGIEERMQGKYTSDKVDFNANLGVRLYGESEEVAGEKKIRSGFWNYYIYDSYIKIRPVESFQIGLASFDQLYDGREIASGAYFPVIGGSTPYGNYTGNLGLLFKPIEGLSIGAGIDFQSYFINSADDNADQVTINFGAEYDVENIGSFAVTFNDVVNHFTLGAYAKISAVEATDIYAGFTFRKDRAEMIRTRLFSNVLSNWAQYIHGKLFLNAGFEYKGIDRLTLAADLATNLFTEDAYSSYDLYTGFKAEYDINESFSIGAKSLMFFDITDKNETEYYDPKYKTSILLYPEVAYKLGNNTFKAGFKMEFSDGDMSAAIPLSWSYSF